MIQCSLTPSISQLVTIYCLLLTFLSPSPHHFVSSSPMLPLSFSRPLLAHFSGSVYNAFILCAPLCLLFKSLRNFMGKGFRLKGYPFSLAHLSFLMSQCSSPATNHSPAAITKLGTVRCTSCVQKLLFSSNGTVPCT